MKSSPEAETLDLVRAGIDTYQEPVVYLRADCTVRRAEGFEAQTRIAVHVGERSIIATPNVVSSSWLPAHQVARLILEERGMPRRDPNRNQAGVSSPLRDCGRVSPAHCGPAAA